MSSRLDYLIKKLDDLEDDIRRETKEYNKARDRYDKMRSRDILDDLAGQLLGYKTEHDKLQRARSSREKARPTQPQHRQNHHPPGRPSHPPNSQPRQQQHMPPPRQHRQTYPHRPAPQQNASCPPRDNYGPTSNSNRNQRPAPPRPHQKTQMVDYEVEEPDGKSYIVRGGSEFRDFDPARDTVRRPE